MRSRYKIIENSQPYFITSTIVDHIPVFTKPKYFNIIIDTFRFYQNSRNLKIYAYVILDNHFHFILSYSDLSNLMKSLKRFTAKRIIEELEEENRTEILNQFKYHKKEYKTKSQYQVWQEGFHPQQIINDEMLRQKIEYIHYNPVKKGLVEEMTDWKYSSAKDYYSDERGLLEIERVV